MSEICASVEGQSLKPEEIARLKTTNRQLYDNLLELARGMGAKDLDISQLPPRLLAELSREGLVRLPRGAEETLFQCAAWHDDNFEPTNSRG